MPSNIFAFWLTQSSLNKCCFSACSLRWKTDASCPMGFPFCRSDKHGVTCSPLEVLEVNSGCGSPSKSCCPPGTPAVFFLLPRYLKHVQQSTLNANGSIYSKPRQKKPRQKVQSAQTEGRNQDSHRSWRIWDKMAKKEVRKAVACV